MTSIARKIPRPPLSPGARAWLNRGGQGQTRATPEQRSAAMPQAGRILKRALLDEKKNPTPYGPSRGDWGHPGVFTRSQHGADPRPASQNPPTSPVVDALMGGPQSPPAGPAMMPRDPLAPAQPQTGPYQGAAGSETQNPGRQRTPTPDWADPNSPNYERRNYYIHPVTGEAVAREPGYYNSENPWDTGRPGESQGEFARTYGYGADAIAPYERRMDEPGVKSWGPGGKASAPGTFQGPSAPASRAQGPARGILDALTGDRNREREPLFPGMGPGRDNKQVPLELLAFLRALLQKGPAGAQAPRVPFE